MFMFDTASIHKAGLLSWLDERLHDQASLTSWLDELA